MLVRAMKQWNVEDTEPPVAISRDGQVALVATGISNSIIRSTEVAWPRQRNQRPDGHSSNVQAPAIAPDRRRGASGSYDGEIRLWDLTTGRLVSTLEGHTRRVTAIEFSGNGKGLLSGS